MSDDNTAIRARHAILLKVYDAAINEYRFNVNLAWERTKFFLLLNSSLIAAGVGLIAVSEDSVPASIFLTAYFMMLIALTLSGRHTVRVGKGFYREANYIKTVAERELGLLEPLPDLPKGRDNLSIAVTDGQRDYERILSGEYMDKHSADRDGRSWTLRSLGASVTGTTEGMFFLMVGVEVIGAIISWVNVVVATTD